MATDSKDTRTKADYNSIVERYQSFKQSLSDKLARIDDLKNELKRLDVVLCQDLVQIKMRGSAS